jgi:hypothetical protein
LLQRCAIYSDLWHQQNAHVAVQSPGAAAVKGPLRVA